jgi:hypothetical protein
MSKNDRKTVEFAPISAREAPIAVVEAARERENPGRIVDSVAKNDGVRAIYVKSVWKKRKNRSLDVDAVGWAVSLGTPSPSLRS